MSQFQVTDSACSLIYAERLHKPYTRPAHLFSAATVALSTQSRAALTVLNGPCPNADRDERYSMTLLRLFPSCA
jgi:hypothetical protein